MINHFPIWKYIVIILILVTGIVYMLPNLYLKEDFAVYITQHVSNDQEFNVELLSNVRQILKNEKINSKSVFLYTNKVLIRFFCEQEQLDAYETLSKFLSNKYIISFGMIPSVPNWLFSIKAKPIKLGLDLRGGVYLAMRVNIETVLDRVQNQYIDTLSTILNEKFISYVKICKILNNSIAITFRCFDDRNKAILYFSKIYNDLILHTVGSDTLHISFSDAYIHKMCENSMQQNIVILRHRIHQLGIIDPIIQRYGDRYILIELPGIQDITNIKTILSTSVALEFRLVNTNYSELELKAHIISEDSEIKLTNDGYLIPLYKKVVLTGDYITNANVGFDEYHRLQVNVTLNKIGSAIIYNVTKDNIGKKIAMLFIEYRDSGEKNSEGNVVFKKHETVINVATIQSQLSNNFSILGIDNLNEARRLAFLLRMGTLAAPVYIETERIIGPTLGKENISQGLMACSLGMLISVCFMILWYHFFGIIASIALIMNLILMISIMSLIPEVTLTMSSIAGVVLTLSVAIDANVLINERIKEEIMQGKPIQYAIYMGYRKSFTTIFDANITTIITSIILYLISTGSIQGFAITTIIGVITSMFTSVIGTRSIVNLIYGGKNISKLSI